MANKSKSIYLTLPDSTLNRAAWERPRTPKENETALRARAYAMGRIRDMNGWA